MNAITLADRAERGAIVNGLSVDVEAWFQVGAFESVIERDEWCCLDDRVQRNVHEILDLFDEVDAKATFFTLGWVAQRHGALLREIAARGHELASHGWDHQRVFRMDRKSFGEDVGRAQKAIEDAAGVRVTGYRAALAEAGIAPDPRLEAPVAGVHRAHGAAAMELLLARVKDLDAVFCFTDLFALGAIRTLVEHGVDVPGDIAVVGFDGIEEGRYSNPSLSTVDQDTERIAQLAVDLLAERLAAPAPPRAICVEHRIVARESTLGRAYSSS